MPASYATETTGWRLVLIGQWVPLRRGLDWQAGPFDRPKGDVAGRLRMQMSAPILDRLARFFHCIGRLDDDVPFDDSHLEGVDHRLSDLERRQIDITSRVRLLEAQSNPRPVQRSRESAT